MVDPTDGPSSMHTGSIGRVSNVTSAFREDQAHTHVVPFDRYLPDHLKPARS